MTETVEMWAVIDTAFGVLVYDTLGVRKRHCIQVMVSGRKQTWTQLLKEGYRVRKVKISWEV